MVEWGAFFSPEISPSLKLKASYLFLQNVFKFHNKIISRVKIDNKNAISYNKLFGAKEYKKDEKYIYFYLNKEDFYALKNPLIIRIKSQTEEFLVKFANI